MTPSEFLIGITTEHDPDAIGEQDHTPLDSTTECGDRRHVHEESDEAMPAPEAATHAAMCDHTFQVTNDDLIHDQAPQTAH